MALAPGTRLGVYQVTAQIGEGGMGQVYRATDTRLKRQVAIKILPPSVAADHDRLTRFQREAEVLASLNHPHIAGIYGLEESDGVSALVMELVEGEDLSQILEGLRAKGSGLPLDEALAIAKQIAEALEAAHEQGIIHRDLKPANIKVRSDGTVKVLDFGLAKALRPSTLGPYDPGVEAELAPPDMSPTLSIHATQAGIILGTAAYMSPEQAKGRAVDKRADIWAFGVVLYEMLTGRRAFDGEDISDLLVAVLSKDVDLTALPSSTPSSIVALIRRCLTRDPKKRLRDIGDARQVLEDPAAIESTVPVTGATAATAPTPPRALPWMAAFGGALLAAVALSIPAVRYLRQTPPPETRVDIVTPATAQPTSFALSPDGRQIVFAASDEKVSRLWLRSLSTTAAKPLTGSEGAIYPFWSPDGDSVGFFAGGALKRLDLGGGAPQTLAPAANGRGGTWNADGVIVFAPNLTSPLMRGSATGGAATPVTTLGPQHLGHLDPQFLPDGRRLLFTVDGLADVNGIYLGGLDGGSPTQLASVVSSGVYAPAGWLLWVRAGSLIAQRLDVQRPALTGEPVALADGVDTDSIAGRIAVSVAATGMVAYRSGGAQRQLAWFDRSGTMRGVVGEPTDTVLQPRVSPDGRRVAVVNSVQDNRDIWLLDGARASRFTFDAGQDHFHVWSPDGTRMAYKAPRGALGALYSKLTSGAGVEEELLRTDQSPAPTSWSADGRFLLYFAIDPETNADLWVLPMNGKAQDRKPFVFLKTSFREAYGTFSPDGRWVAYHSNESGRPEIYVRPFLPPGATGTTITAAGGQWQVSTAGGIHPLWRSDGKELFYINPDGAMMAAPITVTGASLDPGAPVTLFPTRIYGGGADIQLGRQYDVAADGRFLINASMNEAVAPITLIQNWNPEAKK